MGGSRVGSVLPPAPPPQFLKPFSRSQCSLKDRFPGEPWGPPHRPKSLERSPVPGWGILCSPGAGDAGAGSSCHCVVCVLCQSPPAGKSGVFQWCETWGLIIGGFCHLLLIYPVITTAGTRWLLESRNHTAIRVCICTYGHDIQLHISMCNTYVFK